MTKNDLKENIKKIFSIETTNNPQTAEELKDKMSEDLSNLIDSYIQDQVGQRLELILEAIQCPGPDGMPVRAIKFNDFVRKK